MKIAARAHLIAFAVVPAWITGCAYTPALQSSQPFERHPGVFVEVVWQYSYDGIAYPVTNLINRSGTDKCAWTDALNSRVLRAGEMWQVSQWQSPGGVGVSNIVPSDPNCLNAKRDQGQ